MTSLDECPDDFTYLNVRRWVAGELLTYMSYLCRWARSRAVSLDDVSACWASAWSKSGSIERRRKIVRKSFACISHRLRFLLLILLWVSCHPRLVRSSCRRTSSSLTFVNRDLAQRFQISFGSIGGCSANGVIDYLLCKQLYEKS